MGHEGSPTSPKFYIFTLGTRQTEGPSARDVLQVDLSACLSWNAQFQLLVITKLGNIISKRIPVHLSFFLKDTGGSLQGTEVVSALLSPKFQPHTSASLRISRQFQTGGTECFTLWFGHPCLALVNKH